MIKIIKIIHFTLYKLFNDIYDAAGEIDNLTSHIHSQR